MAAALDERPEPSATRGMTAARVLASLAWIGASGAGYAGREEEVWTVAAVPRLAAALRGADERTDVSLPPIHWTARLLAVMRSPDGRARAAVLLALAVIFAISTAILPHDRASRGSLPTSVGHDRPRGATGHRLARSDPRHEARGAAPRGAHEMNGKQILAAAMAVGAMTTGAAAQEAVQWRVEDGGNGHWYRVDRTTTPLNWSQSRDLATGSGGALATVHSDAQNLFLLSLVLPQLGATEYGPWLGARRRAGTSPSTCDDWRWEDDSPFDYVPIMPPDSGSFGYGPCGTTCECLSNADPNEPYLQYWSVEFPIWNSGLPWATSPLSLIEWSADCNNDGIVDYGQILAGALEDLDGNGVPDCCTAGSSCAPCAADLDRNGAVDGIDLAVILNNWGTNGGKDYPNADIDGDGTIGGSDLAQVLGNWGLCP